MGSARLSAAVRGTDISVDHLAMHTTDMHHVASLYSLTFETPCLGPHPRQLCGIGLSHCTPMRNMQPSKGHSPPDGTPGSKLLRSDSELMGARMRVDVRMIMFWESLSKNCTNDKFHGLLKTHQLVNVEFAIFPFRHCPQSGSMPCALWSTRKKLSTFLVSDEL